MHSEMGPFLQNPIQRTVIIIIIYRFIERHKSLGYRGAVRTAHLSVLMLCMTSVHNTAQNSSDNLPSYLETTITAQMLSSGGEGVILDQTYGYLHNDTESQCFASHQIVLLNNRYV